MASNSTLLSVLVTSTTDEPIPFLNGFVFLFSTFQFVTVILVLGIPCCGLLGESKREKLLTLLGSTSPGLCVIVWIAYDKGSTGAWAVISCLALLPVSLFFVLIFYRAYYTNRRVFVIIWITSISSLVTGIVALINENEHYMDANVALTVITYVSMAIAPDRYVPVTDDSSDAFEQDESSAVGNDKSSTTVTLLRFQV